MRPRFHFLHPLFPFSAHPWSDKAIFKRRTNKEKSAGSFHASYSFFQDEPPHERDDLQLSCHSVSCPAFLRLWALQQAQGGLPAPEERCEPKTELKAIEGWSGAALQTCHLLQVGGPKGARAVPRHLLGWRRLWEHTAGWQKPGQGTARSLTRAEILQPAYGIKRKAALRAAATSRRTERGTQRQDFRAWGWETSLQHFLWGLSLWTKTSPKGSWKPATVRKSCEQHWEHYTVVTSNRDWWGALVVCLFFCLFSFPKYTPILCYRQHLGNSPVMPIRLFP